MIARLKTGRRYLTILLTIAALVAYFMLTNNVAEEFQNDDDSSWPSELGDESKIDTDEDKESEQQTKVEVEDEAIPPLPPVGKSYIGSQEEMSSNNDESKDDSANSNQQPANEDSKDSDSLSETKIGENRDDTKFDVQATKEQSDFNNTDLEAVVIQSASDDDEDSQGKDEINVDNSINNTNNSNNNTINHDSGTEINTTNLKEDESKVNSNINNISNSSSNSNANSTDFDMATAKKILFYTTFYRGTEWPNFGVGNKPFLDAQCPVSNCYLTYDKQLLGSVAKFDALMFNLWFINIWQHWEKDRGGDKLAIPDPSERSPHQRYIFYMMDPTYATANLANLNASLINGIFNWTMTYRWDSTFTQPYGWIQPLDHKGPVRAHKLGEEPPFKWLPRNKTFGQAKLRADPDGELMQLTKRPRMVSWVVSHCNTPSKRKQYVRELKKYVDVAIYGYCGEDCGKRTNNCTELTNTNFKFYLSFENSFCDYYVTEKFFKAMRWSVVPIVMGSVDYASIAPPHSYIDIKDFESPKALAAYLKFLNNHPEEYLSYFWWKDHYFVNVNPVEKFRMTMCQLCQRLHNPDEPQSVFNEYDDFFRCHEPPFDYESWDDN